MRCQESLCYSYLRKFIDSIPLNFNLKKMLDSEGAIGREKFKVHIKIKKSELSSEEKGEKNHI